MYNYHSPPHCPSCLLRLSSRSIWRAFVGFIQNHIFLFSAPSRYNGIRVSKEPQRGQLIHWCFIIRGHFLMEVFFPQMHFLWLRIYTALQHKPPCYLLLNTYTKSVRRQRSVLLDLNPELYSVSGILHRTEVSPQSDYIWACPLLSRHKVHLFFSFFSLLCCHLPYTHRCFQPTTTWLLCTSLFYVKWIREVNTITVPFNFVLLKFSRIACILFSLRTLFANIWNEDTSSKKLSTSTFVHKWVFTKSIPNAYYINYAII